MSTPNIRRLGIQPSKVRGLGGTQYASELQRYDNRDTIKSTWGIVGNVMLYKSESLTAS